MVRYQAGLAFAFCIDETIWVANQGTTTIYLFNRL
jgi:hypothetical protein